MRGLAFVPSPRVSFDRLPLELRYRIFRVYFAKGQATYNNRNSIERNPFKRDSKGKCYKGYLGDTTKISGGLNLLLVNRQFGNEAKEFLYRDQHFVFEEMSHFKFFMQRSGPNVKHPSHITVRRNTQGRNANCHNQLKGAPNPRSFEVKLQSSFKAALSTHLDRQYEDFKG